MVEQIVTLRNSLTTEAGFASVVNEFLGVTICSTTLSAICYLYNVKCLLSNEISRFLHEVW